MWYIVAMRDLWFAPDELRKLGPVTSEVLEELFQAGQVAHGQPYKIGEVTYVRLGEPV